MFSEQIPRDWLCPHLQNNEITLHFKDMNRETEFFCPEEERFKGNTAELEKQRKIQKIIRKQKAVESKRRKKLQIADFFA